MANHKSAIKRYRQSLKRNEKNRAIKAQIKSLTKKLETVSKEEAPLLLKAVQSKLAKAARKRIIPQKNASRRISKAFKLTAAR